MKTSDILNAISESFDLDAARAKILELEDEGQDAQDRIRSLESQLAASGSSFRKALAAALGIESNDPREDVLLARVREMTGDYERGRRDGWEVCASKARENGRSLLIYEPAVAKEGTK